eukprot:g7836.t1
MTTAHRPTWAPAKGNDEQGGYRQFVPSAAVSAKDLPGHLKLKFRTRGQHSKADLKERDLRTELEIKERKHFEENRQKDLLLLEESSESQKHRPLIPLAADADDEDEEEEDRNSDSEADESEDEEAELLAELERIKKEREREAKKKEQEELLKQKAAEEEEMLTGNPLLNTSSKGKSFNIKRRWDEDVIFKNQSRGEPKAVKRFINDTVRSDFHQKFLQRYIK